MVNLKKPVAPELEHQNPPVLHSVEMQEVFEKEPRGILRWGISAMAFAIVLVVLLSIFIKYPDTLAARVVITTQIPPVSLVSRTSGKIHFIAKDGDAVRKGDLLGYVENSSRKEDIDVLTKEAMALKNSLNRIDLPSTLELSANLQVGDLQNDYLQLQESIKDYQLNDRLKLYQAQIAALTERIRKYKALNDQIQNQIVLQKEEETMVTKKMLVNEKLFKEGVITELDFDAYKIALLQSKRATEASRGTVAGNDIIIAELESRVVEMRLNTVKEREQLTRGIQNALERLDSHLKSWKEQFRLLAPLAGVVSIFKFYSDEQFINSGVEIMSIVPNVQGIYGQVLIPIEGSGKLKVGQSVNIKLDNYPFKEYGTVRGIVHSISAVPQDNAYTVKVELPRGLLTTYKKVLPFKQQLAGVAEIVTDDISLFERVLNPLRSMFKESLR